VQIRSTAAEDVVSLLAEREDLDCADARDLASDAIDGLDDLEAIRFSSEVSVSVAGRNLVLTLEVDPEASDDLRADLMDDLEIKLEEKLVEEISQIDDQLVDVMDREIVVVAGDCIQAQGESLEAISEWLGELAGRAVDLQEARYGSYEVYSVPAGIDFSAGDELLLERWAVHLHSAADVAEGEDEVDEAA
jgi:hypothetical protein